MKKLLIGVLRRLLTQWRVWSHRSLVHVGTDVHIGRGGSFIAPIGITIGNHCYLGKELMIETNAQIGDYALIGNRVAFVGRHDHEYTRVGVPMRFGRWVSGYNADPAVVQEAVVIEDDVWIGYGVTILSGTRVGRGSIIAVGAVVTKDVAPYDIVAGIPAAKVGRRFDDPETIRRHETQIANGRFKFSERGYRHWIVQPGKSE